MQWVDKAFGVTPEVLKVRGQRFEVIAANLANADTPGYKAKDIDFKGMLAGEEIKLQSSRSEAHSRHMPLSSAGMGSVSGDVRYRVPTQPSLDGNTVETDVERAAFMDNAIRYQASVNFLDSKIKSLLLALKGE